MAADKLMLAVDIGGTHVTAALIDMDTRMLIAPSQVRRVVDAAAGAGAIIETWSRCIRAAQAEAVVTGICLAMPGPFDYDNGISLMKGQGKYEALYRLNIKALLAQQLATAPARFFIRNDAACFLQGEVFAGVLGGVEKAAGVTLGTGLGTAFYEGGHAQSADLWSLPFGEGIAEDYLSTRWFVERFVALSGQRLNGVKEIAARLNTDERVMQLFREFGRNLGAFLCRFVEIKNADAVVIGGNIALAYAWFEAEVTAVVHRRHPSVRIYCSALGEAATLYGAASGGYQALLGVR